MNTFKRLLLVFSLAIFPFYLHSLDIDKATLTRLGDGVRRGQVEEQMLQAKLRQEIARIKASSLPEHRKTGEIGMAFYKYQEASRDLTIKYRAEAQQYLFQIANSDGGSGADIRETEGTKIGERGHRGWTGDTDAGGSESKAKKLAEAAREMGLKVHESPGYIQVEGLDLTVHKEIPAGRPSTEAHLAKIATDANSHESYVSVAMADGQPGKKFVQTNDHIKKAMDGVNVSTSELIAKPEKLQGMVKGTLKACNSSEMSRFRITEIMRQHGYEGHSIDLLEDLAALKGGKSIAPETAGMDDGKLKKLQAVCKDVLIEAKASAQAGYELEIHDARKKLTALENQGKSKQAAELQELIFDSCVRANETSRVADEGLKKSGAKRFEKPLGSTGEIDPLGGLGMDGSSTPKKPSGGDDIGPKPPVQPGGTTAKVSRLVGYAGAALTTYEAWKRECEAAKAQGRQVSYINFGANAALDLSGVSGYVGQAVSVHKQLTVENNASLDSMMDDIERGGYDMSKVSDARLMIVATKATIRTVVMTSYEAAKVIPVAGDILGGIENSYAISTSGYDALMAEIEKNRILAENTAAQQETMERVMANSRAAIPLLQKISTQYQENLTTMQTLENLLRTYDNFVALKQQLESNRRNCSALTAYAREVKNVRKVPAGELSTRFESVKKESERICAAVDALLRSQKDQKIDGKEFQTQARGLLDSCMSVKETMAESLCQLADIQALGKAGPMIDGIKSYQLQLTKDLADARDLAQNAKAAAGRYRHLIQEQKSLLEKFGEIRKQVLTGIDFFNNKRAAAGSDQELQLEKARDMINNITIGKALNAEAVEQNSVRLEKMAGLLDSASVAAPPADNGGLDAVEVEAAGKEAARLEGPADQASAALDRALARIRLLDVDLSGMTVYVIVVDAHSGRNISAAYAEMIPSSETGVLRSEANGERLEFRDVIPGNYTLRVGADGYDKFTKRLVLKTIEPGREKDVTETVKLQPMAGMQTIREERQDAVEIDRKAGAVDDAALEKAKNVISGIGSLAGRGGYVTRDMLLEQNNDYYGLAGAVAEYAGARGRGDWVKMFLLGYTPEGNDLLSRTRSLAFAFMAEKFGAAMESGWLVENGGDLSRAVASIDSKDGYGVLARIMAQSYLDSLKDIGLNVSDIKYYNAYAAYNVKMFNAEKLKDERQCDRESEFKKISAALEPVISKGGYAGVCAKLDAFWKSEEWKKICPSDFKVEPAGELARDYRRKFIRDYLLKGWLLWLKEQRLNASRQLVAALDSFCSGLVRAQLTCRGQIVTVPETCQLELTADICGVKSKGAITAGQYTRTAGFREASSRVIQIAVNAKNSSSLCRVNSGCSSYYFELDSRRLPYETTVRGWNIDVTVPPVKFFVMTLDDTGKNIPQGRVKVPSSLPDRFQEFQGGINQVINSLNSGSLSVDEAKRVFREHCAEMDVWRDASVRRFEMIGKVLCHNREIDYKELEKAPESARRPVFDKYQADITAASKELQKLSDVVWKFRRDAEQRLNQICDSRSKAKNQIHSRSKSLNNERSKIYEETKVFNKARDCFNAWLTLCRDIDRSRDTRLQQSATRVTDILYESQNKELEKVRVRLGGYDGEYNQLPGIRQHIQSLQDQISLFNRDLNSYYRKEKGRLFFEKDYSFPDNAIFYENFSWDHDELYNIDFLCRQIKSQEMVARGISEIDRYLARFSQYAGSMGSVGSKIGGIMSRLPSEADAIAAETAFAPAADKISDYFKAMNSAILQKNTGKVNLPGGIRDGKGRDADFVNEALRSMRDIISRYPEVVSDIVNGDEDQGALTQAMRLQSEVFIPDLPKEQQDKFMELNAKTGKIYAARKKLYNLFSLGFFQTIEKLGDTPEARVKGVLELNRQVEKELEQSASMLKSASPSESVEWLKKADRWFGILKDTATLDNLRLRCELQKIIVKRGVLDDIRRERNLPAAPQQFFINGKAVTPQCDFVVLRYGQLSALSPELSKAYEKTEYKDKFKKSFFYHTKQLPPESGMRVELSFGNNMFYAYYDNQGKPTEMPVNLDFLPCVYRLQIRTSTLDGRKNSFLGIEPGVTVVILP